MSISSCLVGLGLSSVQDLTKGACGGKPFPSSSRQAEPEAAAIVRLGREQEEDNNYVVQMRDRAKGGVASGIKAGLVNH